MTSLNIIHVLWRQCTTISMGQEKHITRVALNSDFSYAVSMLGELIRKGRSTKVELKNLISRLVHETATLGIVGSAAIPSRYKFDPAILHRGQMPRLYASVSKFWDYRLSIQLNDYMTLPLVPVSLALRTHIS